MEKQLPKNWVETSPLQISKIIRGVSYGKTDAFQVEFDNSCLILRGGNIQDGEIVDGKDNVYVPLNLIKKEQFIQEHDVVIVGSTGSKNLIGKAATSLYNSDKISFGAFLMNIRASEPINKRYFSYYFQTNYYREAIRNLAGGVNINNIRKEYIENLYFPLPPLAEQNRIVAKLDTLFTQLETIKASMTKIPVLLKEFRQQVLTQAVTGKLTEEWRKGKELGDSKELLRKIKEYYSSNKRWKEINIKSEDYLNIPATWQKSFIGNISDVSNGSTPSRKESSYWNGHIAWIGSAFIQNNRILSVNEFITDEGFKNSSVRLLPKGTVLIAMIGEGKTRAQSAILDLEATINQNIAAMNIDHGFVKSEFLQYYLISNYDKHRSVGNGTGPQALNCQKVRELEFVLPPVEEQQEIISRVESLFAKADAIEQQYQSLKEKIDTLPQALLHKAFKGELTKQLESDGDARELLQQIQTLKQEQNKIGKVKKKKN